MTAPRWACAVLRRVAPPGRAEDVVGDLEEAHRSRVQRRGRVIGSFLTGLEAMDMALTLMRERVRQRRTTDRPSPPNGRPLKPSRTTWVSWLDFKLGFRMLVRYPGLTVVGGLAMAFAILVGASTFEFLNQIVHPTLPLDDGHRIVGIRVSDAETNRWEHRSLHDFAAWRKELESVQDLGAFRTLERNLITGRGRGAPVSVAEISASAFRVARVPPLLGRPLVEADERPGAPPVVVIGYRVWQTRFAGDPDVIGRTVGLGSSQTTVVGVMPEGFAFPVAHGLWVPFRLNVLDYERREGPAILVFGRLAPGVALNEAQAELTILGLRTAADFPDTHEHLRPEVMPFAQSILGVRGLASLGLLSVNLFLVMLVVLVCSNVALLMFARAATRENEMVVRNALGASRGRIIMQLFAEALVLGIVAAAVGLSVAGLGLRWGLNIFEQQFFEAGRLPFWFDDSLAPATVLYAGGLTVLGAVIAGVVPALKVTGRGVEAHLRRAAVGSGLRFGGLWTGVIVTQVAVTVVFPVTAFLVQRDVAQIRSVEVGFPAEEYLSVRVEMDPQNEPGSAEWSRAEYLARFTATYEELERRLEAEPAVTAVTFADRLPRMYHPHRLIEVDKSGPSAPDSGRGHRVSSVRVDVNYFDVLDTPILSGRGFHSGDLDSEQGVVIVNQSFIDRVLAGSNPIGRRVRYLFFEELRGVFTPDREHDPWYEIVGVVRDLGTSVGDNAKNAGFYHPVAPDSAYPVQMAVHVRGDPESFAPRLRTIAAAVGPTLRLDEIQRLDQVHYDELRFYAFWFTVTVLVSSIALLLSTAGIYAVMSFTVSQRTREIGIRVALGSDQRRVVASILSRPVVQVGLGVVAGGFVVGALAFAGLGSLSLRQVGFVVAYAVFMMGVCMLACIVPTRRALRVEPTEALRADG